MGLRLVALLLLVSGFLHATTPPPPFPPRSRPRTCYEALVMLQLARHRGGHAPVYITFNGTDMPIAHALEKEGLWYGDIAPWFGRIEKKDWKDGDNKVVKGAASVMTERLDRELDSWPPGVLWRWLRDYAKKYRAEGVDMKPAVWDDMAPRDQLKWLLSHDNPFDVINVRGREALFFDGILNYDQLRPTAAPRRIVVGNDLGSYEVRNGEGVADRREFQAERQIVEQFLDGLIGHQHLIHAWPTDAGERVRIGPRYIELLDAATWYLYWRQMTRSPADADSILTHKFLGVYTSESLDRLFRAFLANEPRQFRNKYRMIGARNFSAQPQVTGQEGRDRLPDWELRSGNKRKGSMEDFLEDLLEARFWSGDYEGLRDFREYRARFNPSASTEEILRPWMTGAQIARIREFEDSFPLMKWNPHPLANNHVRNKILAPLLDWGARIPLGWKAEALARAQARYAEALLEIAAQHKRRLARATTAGEIRDAREATIDKLERLNFLFASRLRLDLDFEKYLTPRWHRDLPSILVPGDGPIDVNEVNLGIEYSFRFADPPRGREAAEFGIREFAEAFAAAMDRNAPAGSPCGRLEQMSSGGHGHGLSIRFQYTAWNGEVWRIEWDGIRRSYVDGEPARTRRGHIEVPSPKKAPKDMSEIVLLYRVGRDLGNIPSRAAGGAHGNMDLAPLFDMGPKRGPRMLLNLIAYFESNREMIQFLWQHPFRLRNAMPAELTPQFVERINAFDGTWDEAGRMLYEERYFNQYITRKPAYSQMNATAVMGDAIPDEYNRTIDIKKPETIWFPAFGGKGRDKIELRLFDAPPDEYIAALQLKYMRALMRKVFRHRGTLRLQPVYGPGAIQRWKEDPAQFIRDAEAHYRSLDLDPREFSPLTADALRLQYVEPSAKDPLEKFDDFLPPRED